jgi:hypothetical protein
MFDILSIIPGRKKATGSGWTTFNAVCCIHFGHKADRRGRGGVITDGTNNFTYHCFNCGFKARFTLGKRISANLRQLLGWCGVEDVMIQKWSLESLQHKDLINTTPVKKWVKDRTKFKEKKLPSGEFLDPENELHKKYIDYLHGRDINYRDYPFLVTPNERGRNGNRIIIPYTHDGKIVGHISRFLDERIPKYVKEQQTGYVFGYDFQKPDWPVCIVTEGIFDALSLNACALTQNTFNPEQIKVLASLNRQIIFVPHQDKSGLPACEHALELGYKVSLPNWEPGIKDINEAIVAYGRLPTLLSILQSATTSLIKIELKRKQLAKRL